MSKVTILPNDCWEYDCAGRYGKFWMDGKTIGAHVAAYKLFIGAIPEGLVVRHRCDFTKCCNPDHLVLGTVKDNCNDAVKKDRHSRGMRNGLSKLNDDDVRQIRAALKNGASKKSLSKLYPVTRAVIQRIDNGSMWKHVQ